MEIVDTELASKLESLGRGVGNALDHILDIVKEGISSIEQAAPRIVLVKSRPRDWVCSICGTGMLTTNRSVFVHTCELDGVFHDG